MLRTITIGLLAAALALAQSTGTATMTGAIGECVLYLSGRRDAAVVELTGDPEAIDALRTAKLGI